MRVIEVDMIFLKRGKEVDPDVVMNAEPAFKMEDGTIITEFDGCDWKENPANAIVKLTKKAKKSDEIVELEDGSDTLWYGILRAKKPKKKSTKKAKKTIR